MNIEEDVGYDENSAITESQQLLHVVSDEEYVSSLTTQKVQNHQ